MCVVAIPAGVQTNSDTGSTQDDRGVALAKVVNQNSSLLFVWGSIMVGWFTTGDWSNADSMDRHHTGSVSVYSPSNNGHQLFHCLQASLVRDNTRQW